MGSWITAEFASESVVRAVFGAWVTICATVVPFCVRSVYRAKITRRLLKNVDRGVDLWKVSPASSILDIFALRSILARAFRRSNYSYIVASLACVVGAVITASSATIADHAVVKNMVPRMAIVPGNLALTGTVSLDDVAVNMSSRVAALEFAHAPLDQLFDFVPDDNSQWIYVENQWNNSWRGNCTFYKRPSVDLVLFPSNTTRMREEVPDLIKSLPEWVSTHDIFEGSAFTGWWYANSQNGSDNNSQNATYLWRDIVINYILANWTNQDSSGTLRVALTNFHPHNVSRLVSGSFLQAPIKSDVHVADCIFHNPTPLAPNQAFPNYHDLETDAAGIKQMFQRRVLDASIASQPVIQPTGQEMFRYWQAYLSVKDTLLRQPQQRELLVSRPTVQIRLSVLVSTVAIFLSAIVAAGVSQYLVRRRLRGRYLQLPSSELGWTVQAVRENYKGRDVILATKSFEDFPKCHDIRFAAAMGPDEEVLTWLQAKGGDVEMGVDEHSEQALITKKIRSFSI